jgi:fructose-1,6-bisphosphatase/inositol monophosphatase family enzyme
MTELPASASGVDAVAVARACAAASCEVIRAHFRNVSIGVKGNRNIVTEADVASERATIAVLAREFPGHAILAEETASEVSAGGWMWVCDPIDGTKNFAQGIPHFAYSLALCHDGEPMLGLTVHPLLGWEFLAVTGRGCTYDGTRCAVSGRPAIGESVIAIDLGFDTARGARQLELATRAWAGGAQSIRVSGSAALGFAYVAAGIWDGYVHAQLSPWDIAAGIVLVREAGGLVTGTRGERASLGTEGAIAGTPAVHAEVLRLVASDPGP